MECYSTFSYINMYVHVYVYVDVYIYISLSAYIQYFTIYVTICMPRFLV